MQPAACRSHSTSGVTSGIIVRRLLLIVLVRFLTFPGTHITDYMPLFCLLYLLLALAEAALGVRQVFVWKLGNGVGGAAGAKAVRIALYNRLGVKYLATHDGAAPTPPGLHSQVQSFQVLRSG